MNETADFMPLTVPVFHILLALSDGERHGYAMLQEIESKSDGSVKLGTGTLYTAIKRMLASGLIERTQSQLEPDQDDERRRYYRITTLGKRVAAAEAARMEALVGLARAKRVF